MNNGAVPPSPRPTLRHPRTPVADNASLSRPQSAALRGASKAFTSSNPPRLTTNASHGQNGAAAAAAAAGLAKQKKTTLQPPTPQWHTHLLPRSPPRRVSLVQDRVKLFESSGAEGLQNDTNDESVAAKTLPSQSPSHLAAKLAAQRSTTTSPAIRATNPPVQSQNTGSKLESDGLRFVRRDTVIQRKAGTPSVSPARSTIVAPKPSRPQPLKVKPLEAAVAALQIKTPHNGSSKPLLNVSTNALLKHSPAAAAAARAVSPLRPQRPPLQTRKSSNQSNASWRSLPPDKHLQPLLIQKFRRSDEAFSPASSTVTSSASFYSTTSHVQGSQNSSAASLPLPTVNITPTTLDITNPIRAKPKELPDVLPFRRQLSRPPLMQQSTGTTIDSLASAIVASSVATSRATSPTRSHHVVPPTPSRRHRSPAHHTFPLFAHHTGPQSWSRPTSPPKPHAMKTTMRARSHSTDLTKPERDKRYHKHKHIVRKAPNKHHEGSRARWRDEVPEAARKRYEGVWAANKGLLLPQVTSATRPDFQASSDIVVNVVVRDIWSRSRLPDDVLEEVWDLVDRRRAGVLFRDEFVVGMWLIDQRLKGRKLPVRISESVWDSVRYLKDTKIWRYKP